MTHNCWPASGTASHNELIASRNGVLVISRNVSTVKDPPQQSQCYRKGLDPGIVGAPWLSASPGGGRNPILSLPPLATINDHKQKANIDEEVIMKVAKISCHDLAVLVILIVVIVDLMMMSNDELMT